MHTVLSCFVECFVSKDGHAITLAKLRLSKIKPVALISQKALLLQSVHAVQGERQATRGTDASRQSATSQASGYQPSHTSQTSTRQAPTFSSESPSARWSSSSPSAAWGNSQSAGNQGWSSQAEGATGPSLLQKVKEYLPGTGQGQTQSTGVSSEGQRSNRDDLPVVPVVSYLDMFLSCALWCEICECQQSQHFLVTCSRASCFV